MSSLLSICMDRQQQSGDTSPPGEGFPWARADSVHSVDGDGDATHMEDIYSIHRPIKTSYKNVIIENKHVDSFQEVDKINHAIFKYSQLGLYRLLSTLFGWSVSGTCGCMFGLANFLIVFLAQPFIKMMFVFMRIWQLVFRATVRAFCDPCFQSIGQNLSFMRGSFSLNVTKSKAAGDAEAGGANCQARGADPTAGSVNTSAKVDGDVYENV